MIEWLIQRRADIPQVAPGVPPEGLLSAPESTVYADLYSEKRRQDWLLGRWTAKKLIQAAAKKSGTKSPANTEISILSAKDGAPEVWITEQDSSNRGEFTLSISHSNGVALCAAACGTAHLLGADIELILPRAEGFAADYFSEIEQRTVRESPRQHRACLVTAIWSGKEAALKAVRQGLRLDTRAVSCIFYRPIELSEVWQPFRVQWRDPSYPRQQGWWRIWGDYVLTIVVGSS
jgi:4'-phosphopantetheinyl transferase